MIAPIACARPLLGTLLLALAALTLSCGESGTASSPSPSLDEGTSTATGAGPPPDVTLEAFRYRLSFELTGTDWPFSVVQSGEVVLPDREHSLLVVETGALKRESERLAVGQREWVRGDLPWIDLAMSPLGYLDGAGRPNGLADLDFVNDTIDDQPTRRYALDADTLRRLVENEDLVNPDGPLDATLWVSTDLGIPVRLVVVGGSDADGKLQMIIEVYDVNATDIEIDEPRASARPERAEGERS